MTRAASPDGAEQAALLALLRAIGSRERMQSRRLLAESPHLARASLQLGATRAAPKAWFFEPISHYAYAGDTALHLAAAAHDADLAQQLLAFGAAVRAKNRRGAEALHYASDGAPGSDAWAPAEQYRVVQLLLRAGAEPSALDKSGVLPLHRAVRTRSFGALRALLEHGADARRPNANGSPPLQLAVQNTGRSGSGSTASRDAQAEVIRLLLAHGADPDEPDAAGKSARDRASSDWIGALLEAARGRRR